MKNFATYLLIVFGLMSIANLLHAQENLELYRGNSKYKDGQFDEAKIHYEKALAENPTSFKGTYNLGNATYKGENFEDAVSFYEQAIASTDDNMQKAEAMHNLGNTYLQSGKYEESIKAYKNSLRLNPAADDTRYNLAFAQKMLQKQEQQQQQEEQNKDEQDKEENQDQENQDNKDEQDSEDKKEGDEKSKDKKDEDKDEKGDPKKNEPKDGDEKKEQQPQPKPIELTPREAEQLLEAAKNEDQMIQMQLRQQQKANPKKIDKDW